jgi:hypothetical protein
MRLELTISCLGSKRSTTELHPLGDNGVDYTLVGKGMSSLMKIECGELPNSVILLASLKVSRAIARTWRLFKKPYKVQIIQPAHLM